MEWISQYGLFLAKIATFAVVVAAAALFILSATQRKGSRRGELTLVDLGEQYRHMQEEMQVARMPQAEQKLWNKAQKKKDKAEAKLAKQAAKSGEQSKQKPCLFVLEFKGSMDAHEVEALREEITAVLAVAKAEDEVLLKLESPGGVVHGYGLAASQLDRLRKAGVRLTVAVDKVAASGGYMMACVADRIVAAPFAIVGSIGVVAQIPNFHRLLKKNAIDVELHTAGEFKRTLTLLGENTEAGREKFREELNETHRLFKAFVSEQRPSLDIDAVATGEHWFGVQAKEKGLIDEIGTSDDLLIAQLSKRDVIGVRYAQRKRLIDRLTGSAAESCDRLLLRWWQRGQKPTL
ncbi:protease SohB [Leminorella grimontii]|uniref:Protease SohB n=1 Tax=Leminorella grimontii TaxID=82981 RepID=A0AAV5N0D8_9GAMM|nr:protease SohB [Leminorella grimontii]KFC96300.1 putative protease [Leminorella grimontii ATCC 33999 = DSM 5078]GKX54509.1 protease SohB [Leminorella grimontii]VFS59058.1 Probable protease sohB [Leminorella grimontii]